MKSLFLITVVLIFTGCTSISSNFSQTGNLFPALSKDYPVQVILTDNKKIEFEEIGSLQVNQSDESNLSEVIEYAKIQARHRGGDVLRLISTNSKTKVFGNQIGVFSSTDDSYIFVIGKSKK